MSSPSTAFTRGGPPRAIWLVPLTMGTKSARAGMYAVPAGPAGPAPHTRRHEGNHPGHARLRADEEAGARNRRADSFLDPRPRRVDEPDHGHALAQRDLAGAVALDLGGAAHGARHHGEVVG